MNVTPEARRFYFHYRLLTQLLPAYALALVSYGSAWLLAASLSGAARAAGGAAFGAGLFIFAGLSRWLAWLGFLLSGVHRRRQVPTAEQVETVAQALAIAPGPRLELQLVELGPVPYLAAGGLLGQELWLSTYALRTLRPEVLRGLLLHEAGHVVAGGRGCAWHDLLWALAYPIAWLLGPLPMVLLLTAALHVSLWLRLEYWLQQRAEAKADRWAATAMGSLAYARALAEYLAVFEDSGSTALRRSRLRAMGLSAAEITAVLH